MDGQNRFGYYSGRHRQQRGRAVKCYQSHQQLKLYQMRQFEIQMHQNAFGSRAPPLPAARRESSGERERKDTKKGQRKGGMRNKRGIYLYRPTKVTYVFQTSDVMKIRTFEGFTNLQRF